jgi:hypothetical protein
VHENAYNDKYTPELLEHDKTKYKSLNTCPHPPKKLSP